MKPHEVETYVRLYERHDNMNVPFVVYGNSRSMMCRVFLARLMVRRFGTRYLTSCREMLDSVVSYYQRRKRRTTWKRAGVDEDFLAWCLEDLATWASFQRDYNKALEYIDAALELTQFPDYNAHYSSVGAMWYRKCRILQECGRDEEADRQAKDMQWNPRKGCKLFYHLYAGWNYFSMGAQNSALDELSEVLTGMYCSNGVNAALKELEKRIHELRAGVLGSNPESAIHHVDSTFRAEFLNVFEMAFALAKAATR